MPVPVPETPASPALAQRSDAPRPQDSVPADGSVNEKEAAQVPSAPREIDGPGGLEPTRYGDWERRGRCIDF
jgi:hypothetical protein